MAEAKRIERPLSPFMFVQYYRLQLTAVTSVMIRITGNALMVATLLVIWWLLALAAGPGPPRGDTELSWSLEFDFGLGCGCVLGLSAAALGCRLLCRRRARETAKAADRHLLSEMESFVQPV